MINDWSTLDDWSKPVIKRTLDIWFKPVIKRPLDDWYNLMVLLVMKRVPLDDFL
jgi:hypothetical protein